MEDRRRTTADSAIREEAETMDLQSGANISNIRSRTAARVNTVLAPTGIAVGEKCSGFLHHKSTRRSDFLFGLDFY